MEPILVVFVTLLIVVMVLPVLLYSLTIILFSKDQELDLGFLEKDIDDDLN